MNRRIKEIGVTNYLVVNLYEPADALLGCTVGIQNVPVGKEGDHEVFIASAAVPELVHALTAAACELAKRDAYRMGMQDAEEPAEPIAAHQPTKRKGH